MSGVLVSPNPIFILVTTCLASLKGAVVVYRGTGNVYANLWRVRGPVRGDFEGLFVSVAGQGPI